MSTRDVSTRDVSTRDVSTRKSTHPSRRGLLLGGAAGGMSLLLRGLATGLPPAFLLNPARALAQGGGRAPQTLILATSFLGDPINCNAPGAYVDGADHPDEGLLPSGVVQLGQSQARGALVWQGLPAALRERLALFHLQTRSVAHPEQPHTLSCHGSVKNPTGNGAEMLPSMLAQLGAPGLMTSQIEPLPLSGEKITFAAQPLQSVRPTQLKALFVERDGAAVRALRDEALDAMHGQLRVQGTRAQRGFLDRYATSRAQARQLGEELGELLERVGQNPETADGPQDQIVAAVALARLRVAPVITLTLPFGRDNHNDSDLVDEAAETTSGVGQIGDLWAELNAAGLQDEVSFALLNVFGRGLRRNPAGGRDHNRQHGVMLAFGPGFQGGIYGGVTVDEATPEGRGLAIDPQTGAGQEVAEIPASETLEAAATTLALGLGHAPEVVAQRIPTGRAIDAALARR